MVRLVLPEKGNKYYLRKQSGGYGTSIQGFPKQEGIDCLSNCCGYAAGRFNEIGNYGYWKYWNYPPNAEDWWGQAQPQGLTRGQEPRVGSVAVWEGIGSKAGHVAIVEIVYDDGSILTSESGYGAANPFWTTKRVKGNGNWGQNSNYKFLGFIYQPTSSLSVKKGDSGEKVREVQSKLAAKGYLRQNEVDGDFGKITLGAVLAFQFENNLEVDGIVGPKTQELLLT